MTTIKSSLPDLLITLPALMLLFLGIFVIYTSSTQLALQQAIVAIFGLLLYWLISSIDFEFYGQHALLMYIVLLTFLSLVFVIGVETRGSLRWIPVGPFNFQPSEFIKPVMIVLLAKFWSDRLTTWTNIFKSLMFSLPALILVFRQPDLGTVIVLMAVWFVILIGANVSVLKIITLAAVSLILAPLSWILLKEYQRARVLSFLSPEKDPLGLGYNVIQSTIAVGSGQLTGRGLGRGTQSRLQFLPEFRTDFIFASIAEELGLLGSVTVLGLYALLIIRFFKIISLSVSRFGNLIVLGVVSMLFAQGVINIGMNIGVVPITGITLPLLSYGGSSLIATLISLGLASSVSKFAKKEF